MKKKNILTIILSLFCVATSMAQNAENGKTGILLVHYGTSNDNSRMQTIDRLNARVAETFTDCAVVEAYSAPSVIKMLAKRGVRKLSVSQAIDSLKTLGCSKLVVQSTMLLDGVMTEMLKKEVNRVKKDFRSDITGGSDYDMRSEGWRWEAGAKFKFGKHSLLLDLVNDNYHYGNLYQVATKTYDVGDFVRNKF